MINVCAAAFGTKARKIKQKIPLFNVEVEKFFLSRFSFVNFLNFKFNIRKRKNKKSWRKKERNWMNHGFNVLTLLWWVEKKSSKVRSRRAKEGEEKISICAPHCSLANEAWSFNRHTLNAHIDFLFPSPDNDFLALFITFHSAVSIFYLTFFSPCDSMHDNKHIN